MITSAPWQYARSLIPSVCRAPGAFYIGAAIIAAAALVSCATPGGARCRPGAAVVVDRDARIPASECPADPSACGVIFHLECKL